MQTPRNVPPRQIEIVSGPRKTPAGGPVHLSSIVVVDEASEVVLHRLDPPAPTTGSRVIPTPTPVESQPAEPPKLPALIKARVVEAVWYQNTMNSILQIDAAEARKLRAFVTQDTAPPQEFREGKLGFKYALLSISQRKPLILIAGAMAWLYCIVYSALRLTVLV